VLRGFKGLILIVTVLICNKGFICGVNEIQELMHIVG
jgi:hypothetical protein